jgi:hypothetical protein
LNQNSLSGPTTTQTKCIPSENIERLIEFKGQTAFSLSILVLVFSVLAVASLNSSVHAFEYNGTASLEAVDITGRNSNLTTFDGGRSKLEWPIDARTIGIRLGLSAHDIIETEFNIAATPWVSNHNPMKDFDYLDETGAQTHHNGVDIYSENDLDSKVLVFALHSRILPLRTRFISAGFSAGYQFEEFDYRAYNTRQIGFGHWQDQTGKLSGPTSIYTVNYNIFSIGLALKSRVEDTLIITLEASALPLVYAKDEDEHLRRNRVSYTSTSGAGYQASFSSLFKINGNWFISSRYSFTRIATDGHQDQYWYGDDPATAGNDTGSGLSINAKIKQKSSIAGIGVTRRF